MHIKSLYLFTLYLVTLLNCNSQSIQKEKDGFEKYVKKIIEDSTNRWREYPKPPVLPNDLLPHLKEELAGDSARNYFERLRIDNLKKAADYIEPLDYFGRNKQLYTILALSAHWNPDTRVSALKLLYELIKQQPAVLTKKENTDFARFLIYLLKNNPVYIDGSENATIHHIYISMILANLEILTNQKPAAGQSLEKNVRYFTDSLKLPG
ncbi:MAG: hypothetical protein QM791_17405 [Ferruginibacter sp.]